MSADGKRNILKNPGLGWPKKTWPPYSMYYQLTPHKSTTLRFSVAFMCLQLFLHAFLNAKTCFNALQPKTNWQYRSFAYCAGQDWNLLPLSIREASDASFRSVLKQHYLTMVD